MGATCFYFLFVILASAQDKGPLAPALRRGSSVLYAIEINDKSSDWA